MAQDQPAAEEPQAGIEEDEHYEGTAEELTGFKPQSGPAWFDRKKVMITLCVVFSVVVAAGLIFNSYKAPSKQKQAETGSGLAARAPRDFLRNELDRSLRSQPAENSQAFTELLEETVQDEDEDVLPQVVPISYSENRTAELSRGGRAPEYGPPPANESGGGGTRSPPDMAPFSALVPAVEGTLFLASAPPAGPAVPYAGTAGQNPAQVPGYTGYAPAQTADSYAAQNNQADKKAFYDSAASGGSITGSFLGGDLLWIGTIIPAVLETSVNTDLPGNVIARVSENVYDSRTGRKLLLPQGTILVARYNSSVSYAQHRIQIAWDLLIRPDGYQLELGGMNGVDERGMAGIKAEYRENWFEYLKAAGLITMFSLANSRMAEETAKYASNEMAAGVTQANAEFINSTGGNIVSRAMDIQPTLLLNNGEKVNIMLNKNVHLPPVNGYPVTQKYTLK
jgi:type IV secretory pathway VirB10-like protein